MDRSESKQSSGDSQSAAYLRATQLVTDLHRRASPDMPAFLRELLESSTELVHGAHYAGITVTRRRRLSENAAATHRYPILLDQIQDRCQQGPCLTAAASQESVRIDDLRNDDRWPLFSAEAISRTPLRSILSLAMFREGSTTASLNFYAESVNAFDDESVNLGSIFACHTALVWDMMRRDRQFRAALDSRDIIGQAKGRMMERFKVDADGAFEMLKVMSQNSNTPIVQLAQHVVANDIRPSPS